MRRRTDLAGFSRRRALQGHRRRTAPAKQPRHSRNSFVGEARGRAVGTWSAASAIGGAIGAVAGRLADRLFGWREIFLLNIPLASALPLGARLYPRSCPRRADAGSILPVALLAAVSLGLLTWGLTAVPAAAAGRERPSPRSARRCPVRRFSMVEGAAATKAMMPLELFRSSDSSDSAS